MSDYKPKTGDRVKVTLEGTVTHVDPHRIRVVDRDNVNVFAWANPESVEKLPDPEPKWKTRTVAQVGDLFLPVVYTGEDDGWRFPTGFGAYYKDVNALVTEAWQNGTLEILWQPADAE